MKRGWVKNFGDLYVLEHHKDDIIACPGFGEKSFTRLQQAIDKRRTCTLNQFIAALGIPEVGRHAGRILNRHFGGDWDAFEQAIRLFVKRNFSRDGKNQAEKPRGRLKAVFGGR